MARKLDPELARLLSEFDEYEYENYEFYRVKKGPVVGVFSGGLRCLVVPIEYDKVVCFDETRFEVRRGEKWGIFSVAENRLVVPIEYDGFNYMTGALVEVKQGGKRGAYSSTKNRLVVPIEYDIVAHLASDLTTEPERFRVWTGEHCGVYSSAEGRVIVPIEYSNFGCWFNESMVQVWKDEKFLGLYSLRDGTISAAPHR
jgi:hypothetical protein